MLIKSVAVYECLQPLKTPFTLASSGLIDHLNGIYVKLDTCEGIYGIGEVRGNCEYFTGDTPEAVIATSSNIIAPRMLGHDPQNINEMHEVIEKCIVGNKAAKCACDCAVYDLAAKIAEVPVSKFLGGKRRDVIVSEENIPFMSVSEARALAHKYLADGSRFIKVRVGADDFSYDVNRVSAVWNEICASGFANEVVYSVDANNTWQLNEVVHKVNELSKFGVSIVEQPCSFYPVRKINEIKKQCPVKIFGDEEAATLEDVVRLNECGIIDGFHLKLIKCGGITNAVKLMSYAAANGLEYMVGGMDEGMLAVAAAAQCAAIAETDMFELHGYQRIGKDPTSGLKTEGSKLKVPEKNGLGVDVDESMLTKRYERGQ